MRNVMYYGDFDTHTEAREGQPAQDFFPKDIRGDKLTHLNYAFLDFDAQGNLEWVQPEMALNTPAGELVVEPGSASAGLLNSFQELRLRFPNLKIGVSVGGWTKSGDFSPVAADPVIRAKFVNNLVKFVQYNEMDFLDIDWEYPGAVREGDPNEHGDEGTNGNFDDFANYVLLLRELRAGLAELSKKTGKQYELSIAAVAGNWNAWAGTPWESEELEGAPFIRDIFAELDFGNIMTYDTTGSWVPTTSHHTAPSSNLAGPSRAQRSARSAIDYYLEHGAPASKLDVGVAFYTRGWGGVKNDGYDPIGHPGLFATANGAPADRWAGLVPFRFLPELIGQYGTDANGTPNLKEYWDDAAQAPYLYSEKDGVFYTYDNARSIAAKADYVKQTGLGGIITWMASQDAPTNANITVRDELTTAIFDSLYGPETKLPVVPITTLPLNLNAELTGDNADAPTKIALTNNEQLVETDIVLSGVERKHKTVKRPVLVLTGHDGETQTLYLSDQGITEIEPGQTVQISIPDLSEFTNSGNLQSIELAQRIANIPYGHQAIWAAR